MTTLHTSPHTNFSNSVTRMMLLVIVAMVPAMIAYVWFFGWGILINSALCIATAIGCEVAMLKLRHRPVIPFITDLSALVTALLIAFALPPIISWWLPVLATAFAIIIAKHLYGGLGYNPFNPAMAGYVVLLISFPKQMTAWLPANSDQPYILSFIENLRYNFFAELPATTSYDLITQATPLDVVEVQTGLGLSIDQIESGFVQMSGFFGVGWDWVSLMFLLGGLFLISKRVITWQIPVAMIATLALLSLIGYVFDQQANPDPLFHVLGGATMIGAFFIATDPVTASTTPRGRIYYGIGIAIITYVIRTWGNYPDGVAFGVLLMNIAVPTIDYYTKPKVFGQSNKNKDMD
ncbi:Electron transport complex protein RnfD [hydrothermal vent metagenome]|uniref:Electron transport complex protein RnfD n=1 Tax=hydrothermal vent metagenome TaxID=652676 RepID=A0A3B1APK2_9ZZZZ